MIKAANFIRGSMKIYLPYFKLVSLIPHFILLALGCIVSFLIDEDLGEFIRGLGKKYIQYLKDSGIILVNANRPALHMVGGDSSVGAASPSVSEHPNVDTVSASGSNSPKDNAPSASGSNDPNENTITPSKPEGSKPSYKQGTLVPGSGAPSPFEDLQKRLEKMMLESTQGFLNQADAEIQSKDLKNKADSELTPEEVDLLKSRDSHAEHMAKTSANLLTMESKSESRTIEASVDGNINKRDVESADLNSDKKDLKKRK